MDKKAIVKQLMEYSILPTSEMLEEIENLQNDSEAQAFIRKHTKQEGTVEIVQNYEEHIKKREFSDFVMHYNNRFKFLSNLLQQREIQNLTSIRRIQDMKKEDVSTIGMIYEISTTKNGHIMIDLEDKTGLVRVLVTKEKTNLFNFAKNLVHDEVIAVSGRTGDNDPKNSIIFANDILMPDIPVDKVIKKSPEEGKILFISDLHIDSDVFYKKEFEDMIQWIKETPEIKYIIIGGDVVDGVGVYPGQEDEILHKSVKEQYQVFADYLKEIPNIPIIICPGNHDAVRIAEPQPPFNPKFAQVLLDIPNVTTISSPGMVNVGKTANFEGFNIMLYHGFSMPYYGDKVLEIREAGGLSRMDMIMKFYLQRRHFAPTHGSTQFIPDIRKDHLLIEKVPDFLVTGHVHKVVVQNYRGVTMINASGWMKQTEYQKRFGLVPDNCKAVLIDMKTREVQIMDFLKNESKPENQ